MKKKTITLFFAFIAILILSSPTLASSPTTTRLAGPDRYATASSIAKQGWAQSDYAIIACGDNYPDALAAAPLAKAYNAPILLTTSSTLQSNTRQTLIDLKTKTVFIVGGTGVVLPQVEADLKNMGIAVTRFAGSDRYETAVKISEQLGAIKEVFVVTGDDYPDALSVAPIAAMKNMPILLVPRDSIPESVKNYVIRHSITKSYIIGHADIIGFEVGNQFPNPERIIGSDRYERNVAANRQFKADFNTDSFCAATGNGFADALTGAAYAAKKSVPILLVNNDVPSFTRDLFKEL
jgi:putative cell wall-binding protein